MQKAYGIKQKVVTRFALGYPGLSTCRLLLMQTDANRLKKTLRDTEKKKLASKQRWANQKNQG